MTRERWRFIRDAIAQDIERGILAPGAQLPTEAELAAHHEAGRHSVRRAIAELAKLGQLSVEQGRGTFVQPQPLIDYAIGRRTRLRQNLLGQGIHVAGDLVSSERVAASGRAAAKLGLGAGDEMTVTTRITFAEDLPIAYGTLYHDAARFAEYSERREALGSVSAVYRSYGIGDYLRGSTALHARPATPEETQRLKQPPGQPVVVVRSVDTDLDGAAIAYGEVIWAASRVSFSFSGSEDR